MQNHTSLTVIGRIYAELLGSVSMRDLETPAVMGVLLTSRLKDAGFVVTDLEQTAELPGMVDHTIDMDLPCLALTRQAL